MKMNSALGIAVVFDFITLIAVETWLEIFVVDVDVDVVGMVDFVGIVFVIFDETVVDGYWLFDVGIINEVIFIGFVVVDEVVIIGIVLVLSGNTLALGSDNLVDGHGLFDL